MADPITTGATAAGMNPLIGAGMNLAGALIGSTKASPAGPSVTEAAFDTRFDSSGWSVNFGSGGISAADNRTTSETKSKAEGLSALPVSNTVLLLCGGLILVAVLWKLKKR